MVCCKAFPRRQVLVCEADLDLATNPTVAKSRQLVVFLIQVFQLIGQVIDAGTVACSIEGTDLVQRIHMVLMQSSTGSNPKDEHFHHRGIGSVVSRQPCAVGS